VLAVISDGLSVSQVAQKFGVSRSPTTTGKIERFHRSMRVEFLSPIRFSRI
jgi:hypothetical protein